MKLSNSHGSCIPYTRHVPGCPHRLEKDHNDCRCPKWIYENRRGGTPIRHTLNTPSWADALRIAALTHEGFNPEIAAARALKAKAEKQKKSVEEACQMWLDHVEADSPLGRKGVFRVYASLTRKVIAWAIRQRILFIQDVTTELLTVWKNSPDWTDGAMLTRQQRWVALRTFFAFLTRVTVLDADPILPLRPIKTGGDLVQGPFTDEQVAAMFTAIDDSFWDYLREEKRDTYAARLRALMLLLLHSGCDLIDAVNFEEGMIEEMEIDERRVWVYRYHRVKTGVLAVVPMADDVVQTIRAVPMLRNNQEGMPFRIKDTEAGSDAKNWSRRIGRVLTVAQVSHVTLPAGKRGTEGRIRKKKATAKQMRHTFAVRQLRAGQRPEAVARMLGHVDVTMIRKHYAPWVAELDEAHVRQVVAHW